MMTQTTSAAAGTTMYFEIPKSSKLLATPANSLTMLPKFVITRATMSRNVARNPNSSRIRSESPLPVTAPMLVDDGKREQIVFIEQRRDLVLGGVGTAGDERLAQCGELRGCRRHRDLHERNCSGQLAVAGQINGGQRFASAFEPLQGVNG